jgi:putative ABC transport system substrate-binding protein
MKRREFITLIGGAAAAWPLAASAQQGKPVTIGLLGSGTAAAQSEWTAAFVRRLRELGWNEGRNLTIEYRWAEGRGERFAEIAAEFVRLKVDVIVTHNTLPPLAAKQATSVIPIVFATAGDPVGTGIVESLARPGGNVEEEISLPLLKRSKAVRRRFTSFLIQFCSSIGFASIPWRLAHDCRPCTACGNTWKPEV